MSKIRIANGPYRGREKTLTDKAMTIGRDAEAGVQILDRSASRFHCEVFPVGGMWFVRDLDSKNGTYINDERLTDEELLRVGDVIKIGTTELVYEVGSALSDDDSSNRISYNDDPEMLSNTLEFRIDELSDISEMAEPSQSKDSAKGMRILYQVGRILSEAGEGPDKEAKVLDALISAMPAEAALTFRRDPATGKLVPGTVRTSQPSIQPVISRSIIKKTFTENKALHSANAQEDERFDRHASIHSKNIRSVICVPLAVGGAPRGVVYLSRGLREQPFDQFDLELVSAVALQIGLSIHAAEERRRHRQSLWQAMTVLVRVLEAKSDCAGSGERCARACAALGAHLKLSPASIERVRHAGLLHHLPLLLAQGRPTATTIAAGAEHLEEVDDLDQVAPLVRLAWERLDGTGPLRAVGDELDTEARLLAVAAAFEERTRSDAAAEPAALIEVLAKDEGLDQHLVQALSACHLDGSLYGKDKAPTA